MKAIDDQVLALAQAAAMEAQLYPQGEEGVALPAQVKLLPTGFSISYRPASSEGEVALSARNIQAEWPWSEVQKSAISTPARLVLRRGQQPPFPTLAFTDAAAIAAINQHVLQHVGPKSWAQRERKMSETRTFWILIGGVALFVAFWGLLIYFALNRAAGWVADNMGTETERQLGDYQAKAMLRNEKVLASETQFLQAYTDALGLRGRHRPTLYVVESKTVNAFALPGGHMVIYTGMLAKLSDHRQLAALLAHEYAHVERRHGLQGLARSLGARLVIGTILAQVDWGLAEWVIQGGNWLQEQQYSRELEAEADDDAIALMRNSHISLGGMEQLFAILEAEAAGEESEDFGFLLTHPLVSERLAKAKAAHQAEAPELPHPELERAFAKLKGEGGAQW
jgi:beta-barrel assembly-enhancing protease